MELVYWREYSNELRKSASQHGRGRNVSSNFANWWHITKLCSYTECCKYNPVMCEFYTGSKDRNILVWSPEKQQNLSESRANFRSSSLPKNAYSIFSSTGRSGFSSGPQTVNSSENNLEDTFAPNASNRRLDTWSDDE